MLGHVELNNLREENNKLRTEIQELNQQIYDLENRRNILIDLISNGINKSTQIDERDIFDLIITSYNNINQYIDFSNLFFLFYDFKDRNKRRLITRYDLFLIEKLKEYIAFLINEKYINNEKTEIENLIIDILYPLYKFSKMKCDYQKAFEITIKEILKEFGYVIY